jgi:hypothetical protein
MRTLGLGVLVVLAACGGDDGGLPDGVELPTNANGEHAELLAVGHLEHRCGGTFVDVGGGPDAPAYFLTAGHCTGLLLIDGAYVLQGRGAAGGEVAFGGFVDTPDRLQVVPIAEQVYESMIGADLGLYRLGATVGELRGRGIVPIALAPAPPPTGAAMTIVSYPMPVADDPQYVLHLSHCTVTATVRLSEAPFLFLDFVASSCGSIRPGSSGGAVLDDQGRLFGVVSTQATDGPQAPCELDAPCEIDTVARVRAGGVYAAPIRTLPRCFTAGVFDLDAPGCALTRAPVPVVAPTDSLFTTPGGARWQVRLTDAGLPYYRVKAGPVTTVRCESDDGWGTPIAIAERPLFDDPLGDTPGPHALCIHGLVGPTATPRVRFLEQTVMLIGWLSPGS